MEEQEIQAIKNKKRLLKRYRVNMTCIERLEEKYTLLKMRLENAKAINISSMPRGGTPVTTEDLILDKIDLEKRINKLKDKGHRLKIQILEEIDSLEDSRYCEVLEAYFIDCKTIEEIADDMGYSERHIYELYKKGVYMLTFESSCINQ